MEPAGGNDLRLVDPFGNIVFSHSLTSDAGRVTLNTPGKYTLLVEGAIQNTVDLGYTFNVLPVVDPAPQAIALGSGVSGNLAVSGERDVYTFNLASNSLLYFDSLTNSANFNWSLSGPAGNAVSGRLFTASDGLNNSNPVLKLVAGSYTLTVVGAGASTGAYSFRLSDLSAAPPLTTGTAVTGTLAGGNSTNLYQFTATAGQAYYFANQVTSGSGGGNDRLRLVDPYGNILFSQSLTADAGRFTLNSGGKYTLLVEGGIQNTADLGYTLTAFSNVDPAPQALTLGNAVSANLAVSTERDTYTFTLASDTLLYFDSLTNSNNFNWSLSGPAGSVVSGELFAQSDGLNNSNPVLKLVAGDYTLTVAASGTITGAYSFRLSDMAAANALTPGTPVNGTLVGGNSTGLYQFTGTAGQSYYFANQVTSGTGGGNDRLRLVDPFGNILFTQTLVTDAGRITLNSSGKYTILVEGNIQNTDNLAYTLNVPLIVDPAPQALTLGGTVTTSLGVPGEKDAYTFTLASNSLLYFDSLTNNANFNWSLSGPAGSAVSNETFTASDGASINNPVLNLVAGNYTLTVAGAGATTGAYSFRLSDMAAAPALTPGTPINGTLVNGISTDLYRFTATAGQSYYFASQVTSGNGGSTDRLRLVDPFGNLLFPSSQNPTTDAGRITLSNAGKYTVLVEGFIQNSGNLGYTLNVVPDLDPAPQALTLGNTVSKSLAASGEKDAYTFTLAASSLLYFDSLTNNANFNWSLTGPAGSAVSSRTFTTSDGTSNNNPVLNLVAGNYTLTVAGTGATTGAYSFRLLDLAAATSLAVNADVSGTLTGGNTTNMYMLNGTAGDAYTFSSVTTSGAGNNVWRLIDPFGNVLSSKSLSANLGTITLLASGNNTLLIEGQISNTSDVTYTIHDTFNGNTPPVFSGTALTLGNTVNGTLATVSQKDPYTFTLASNSLLYFDALTANSNLNWSLSGPAGTAISNLAFESSVGWADQWQSGAESRGGKLHAHCGRRIHDRRLQLPAVGSGCRAGAGTGNTGERHPGRGDLHRSLSIHCDGWANLLHFQSGHEWERRRQRSRATGRSVRKHFIVAGVGHRRRQDHVDKHGNVYRPGGRLHRQPWLPELHVECSARR